MAYGVLHVRNSLTAADATDGRPPETAPPTAEHFAPHVSMEEHKVPAQILGSNDYLCFSAIDITVYEGITSTCTGAQHVERTDTALLSEPTPVAFEEDTYVYDTEDDDESIAGLAEKVTMMLYLEEDETDE